MYYMYAYANILYMMHIIMTHVYIEHLLIICYMYFVMHAVSCVY